MSWRSCSYESADPDLSHNPQVQRQGRYLCGLNYSPDCGTGWLLAWLAWLFSLTDITMQNSSAFHWLAHPLQQTTDSWASSPALSTFGSLGRTHILNASSTLLSRRDTWLTISSNAVGEVIVHTRVLKITQGEFLSCLPFNSLYE